MNVTDLFSANPIERAAILRALGIRVHYGTPIGWAMEGYRLEMRHQSGRKPTHRGEPRNA